MLTRRHPLHFCNMARTVLLVALALAPAALALGVTRPNDPTIPCDCPETIEGGEIVLPCGADGESPLLGVGTVTTEVMSAPLTAFNTVAEPEKVWALPGTAAVEGGGGGGLRDRQLYDDVAHPDAELQRAASADHLDRLQARFGAAALALPERPAGRRAGLGRGEEAVGRL